MPSVTLRDSRVLNTITATPIARAMPFNAIFEISCTWNFLLWYHNQLACLYNLELLDAQSRRFFVMFFILYGFFSFGNNL